MARLALESPTNLAELEPVYTEVRFHTTTYIMRRIGAT
jgi:hypothetical protein